MSEERSTYSLDGCTISVCSKAPEGWKCTRRSGHEGPCALVRAAVPISEQVTKQFLRDLKTEEWLSPAKVLQELFEEAEERGRREAMPLITDGGDCVVMEWWRDDRKLTLRVPFIMEMVQRFGPKGASKCSEIDGPDEADLQEAVRWLNDALSTDPPASSEQGADNGR